MFLRRWLAWLLATIDRMGFLGIQHFLFLCAKCYVPPRQVPYIYIYLFLPTAILFRVSAFASVNLCRINFIVSLETLNYL